MKVPNVSQDRVDAAMIESLLRNGGSLIPVNPEALEKLSAEWSPPVECKVEDGELVFRGASK